MPRAARIHAPGYVFHIISRCMNREFLIDGPEDRRRYRSLLERGLVHSDAKVLAWCIMSNHIHLVLRAGEDPLWRLLKRVNTGYAQWRNRRTRRLGPVFADRYRAILVEEDLYLKELIRYVHLNPVRAGLVTRPEGNDWSSHRAVMGLAPVHKWFDPTGVLEVFGEDLASARAAYEKFVNDGIGQPRSPLLSGDAWVDVYKEIRARGEFKLSDPILGSESFVAELMSTDTAHAGSLVMRRGDAVRRHRPTLSALIDVICDELELDRTEFEECPKRRGPRLARQLLVRVWTTRYREPQVGVARHLNVPASMVSRWYSRALEHLDEHHDIYEQIIAALPKVENIEVSGTGERLPLTAAQDRMSVNVEFVDEEQKIVTPPQKSSRS